MVVVNGDNTRLVMMVVVILIVQLCHGSSMISGTGNCAGMVVILFLAWELGGGGEWCSITQN